MNRSRRRLVGASLVAAVLAAASVVAVLEWSRDEPDVDGEFVLDEPGIYNEPVATNDITGVALPDVTLFDAGGDDHPWSAFAGRPLVINVWFSGCAPCARELRDFAEVSSELGGQVQFVGVNPDDDAETMIDFASERGVEYPLLLDSSLAFVTGVGVTAYPTTLFVSPDGRILHQTNAIDADHLRATIADVFGD